ncbi:uncharacterized protein LOC119070008 [Bradysia coprophila]|uniref:uncharacterized protein LOC119070008 n=1 Tax=Bradysia coprophila TaxID=38358 RepID=UPI00187D92CC|nr:uncharacterized protein LOC119070008 [Bradysia coprophila]XP_037030179.1 uncharacterized protein LOC119070008 [Bradysia coprophila]
MAYVFNFLTGQGGRAPIGGMSVMKDHMYDTKRFMSSGAPYDGHEISAEKLKKMSGFIEELRDKSANMPHLNIVGNRNEKDDSVLFELVARHCITTTKKLCLTRMKIDIPAEKFQVFPELKEVKFNSCIVDNESILRFNEWCPNVNRITFEELKFGLDAFNAFNSNEATFPNVERLTFSFKKSVKMTRPFLDTLSKRFPMVKELDIIMCPTDDVSDIRPEYRKPYQASHFKNVEKLFVRAFAGDISKLFDYMAICSEKLKEFSFAGMAITDELIAWIKRCTQLEVLTIDWQYRAEDAGCSINNLKGMPSLTKVTLMVKYLDWNSEGIIQFARDNPSLRMLIIEGEKQHNKLNFGKKYKDMFVDLVKQRGKITIKIFNYEDGREVEISEKGFNDKTHSEQSSDDEVDADELGKRMLEMLMHFNNRALD